MFLKETQIGPKYVRGLEQQHKLEISKSSWKLHFIVQGGHYIDVFVLFRTC